MITGQDGFVASAPRQLLVGRRRETEHLRSLLEDALAGRGRLVMLVGKAGIGKTRTAEDLSSYSEFKGAHVLWGRCASTTGGVAFAPWVQILESYVRYRDPQSLRAELGIGAADIAQMVPAVRERLPQVGPARPLESEFARFRLFDEVTTFLKNAAAALPLVLILDDLQLADHSSLLLLGYLARRLSDSPLLLVGTYQVGAVGAGHPLAEIVTPLRQERRCEIVELSGLAEQDTRTLLVALGGKEVSDGLVQRLARKTDGNPFFLQEILWHLVEEGVFTMERDGWVSRGAPEDVPIPAGVRAVIGRRVGRLSPLCQEALTVAAVVDRDIGADVIAAVIEMSRERVQSALSEAVRARLLNEVPNGYRFPHALIAETLYAQLSAERAMQLHSRVGAVLERLHRHDLGPHLADLAHHFLRARADLRRAVDYAARAGERALASLAYEEAARHFTCALEALEGEAADWVESRRSNLLLALGDACWKMGDGQRARETFEAAAASARATGAAEQLARAALGFWGRFERTQVRAKDDRAVELLEQALSALGDDGALRAQVLACLAYALYFVPGTEGRRAALCEEAVIMAERAADARALMRVLHDRVWALWGPDHLDDGLAGATELLRLSTQAGDREVALEAHGFRVSRLLEEGDLVAMDAEIEAFAKLARELRQPWYVWWVSNFQAMRATLAGRFVEAQECVQRAFSQGQPLAERFAFQVFGLQTLTLAIAQGRVADLEGSVREFVQRYPTLLGYRCLLAYIHSEQGREAEASSEIEALAANDFRDLQHDNTWLASCGSLALAIRACRDVRRGALLYELLRPYAAQHVVLGYAVGYVGSVARYLGVLAMVLGRWDEAAAHFEDALARETRMQARPWLAHTRYDYALMLLARGHAADRDEARDLLQQAFTTAEELSLTGLSEKISAKKLTR